MRNIIDLDRFPLDREGSSDWNVLVERSKAALTSDGMFDLNDFLLPGVADRAAAEIKPVMYSHSHEHRRVAHWSAKQ